MSDQIVVVEKLLPSVVVADNSSVVAVTNDQVASVVVYGMQGIPGVAGQDGVGSATQAINQLAVADGEQTIVLPGINIGAGVDVFINGLWQSRASFTVTSSLLTVPSTLNVESGDLVSVIYQV
jgi:hypothetical protein